MSNYIAVRLKLTDRPEPVTVGIVPLFILSLVGGSLIYHVLFAQFLPTYQPMDNLPERIVDAVLHAIKAHP